MKKRQSDRNSKLLENVIVRRVHQVTTLIRFICTKTHVLSGRFFDEIHWHGYQ